MAFDGIGYTNCTPVYPPRHVSHTPCVGQAYGDALRAAYTYARNHARLVISQNTAMSFRGHDLHVTARTRNATYARIAEGFRFIPPEATHLVAETHFRVFEVGVGTTAKHRLAITDGSFTDTGAAVETLVSASPARPFGSDYFFDWGQVLVARYEVELADVAPNFVCEVYAQGFAEDQLAGQERSYGALYTRVWTEIR